MILLYYYCYCIITLYYSNILLVYHLDEVLIGTLKEEVRDRYLWGLKSGPLGLILVFQGRDLLGIGKIS